jgi:purine-nucleoside phosphorylase
VTHPDFDPSCRPPIPQTMWERGQQVAAIVNKRWRSRPVAGLILGTGLGGVARQVQVQEAFDYADLPHFPRSTAIGHRGRLVCGTVEGLPVVAMDGRCHVYEGYSIEQVSLPVIAMAALGIQTLVLSNASGGLNPGFRSGDVMVIEDHINLMFRQAGNSAAIGLRRRAPNGAYDPALIRQARRIAAGHGFSACPGVYVAVTGPNYETRAEYRFLRRIGGDAVGMSTVPEAQAAVFCGVRTLGLSIITNVARPDAPHVVHADEVIAAAQTAEQKVGALVLQLLRNQSEAG